jgi:magnesium-transporting ATPase (P-type)
MSLSSEAVNQSIFVAALFLTLISVPKLLALTVWYAYKEWIFLNLGRVVNSRYFENLTKEGTAEILTKDAGDPKLRVKIMMEALGDFMKNIRDPLIEALTATAILSFLTTLLPAIEIWLVITLIVIVAVVIGTCALTLKLWRNANKMLRMEPTGNPSLNLEP